MRRSVLKLRGFTVSPRMLADAQRLGGLREGPDIIAQAEEELGNRLTVRKLQYVAFLQGDILSRASLKHLNGKSQAVHLALPVTIVCASA